MTLRRIYVPLDDAALDMLRRRREIGPAPLSAHAVTAAQDRGGLATDDAALEYAALLGAAAEAGGRRTAGGRRVIAAADVETALVEEAADPSPPTRVEVDAPVPIRRVVSFHLDEVPGGTDDGDLLWYDVTELDEVLRLGSGHG